MMKHLSGLRVLPRWIIFLLDIACAMLAIAAAFLLRFNFNLAQIGTYHLQNTFLCVFVVNSLVFIGLRTYAGIIRHTSLQDAWRVVVAVTAATLIYCSINLVSAYKGRAYFIPYSVILIAAPSAFALLLMYRLLVKITFDQLFNRHTDRTNVIIYGAGYPGTVTHNVLQASSNKELIVRVVAFIEDDSHSWGKELEGIPIYKASPATLDKLSQRYQIGQLIVTDVALINSPAKSPIVDWCLENKVKIQHVPPMSQWVQGGLKKRQIKDIKIEDLLNRNVIRLNSPGISRQIAGKVILITGAAGSIGSELVRQAAAFCPEAIILCDQAESPLHDLQMEMQESFPAITFHPFIADIRNRSRMDQLFRLHKPKVIFHAAAYKHVPMMEGFPDIAVLNNVLGTIHVADLAMKHGVEKFVMVSTDKAVNPTNVMGSSKRIAEIYIQSLNNYLQKNSKSGNRTAYITTRFGNVLGSNGSVVPHFKKQIEKGGPITVTHPEITRYFMTIPEACQLVLEAGAMGKGGEVFVFDMGEAVKIRDLAVKMIQLSGLTPEKDIQIIYTGLRPGEKLYEELLTKNENIIPTYHEKIMIARVAEYDYTEIKQQAQELIRIAREGENRDVVQQMKNMVPEYQSNNSVFEELDGKMHVTESMLPSA